MRPASAGIRFHTSEEDICCSKPIDWDGTEDGGESNQKTSITRSIQLSKPLRPASAPVPSVRLAATAPQSQLFVTASASQHEGNNVMLDDLKKGYKGMVTHEQLASCPTPRLNLFAPPPITTTHKAASRPQTAGECQSPNQPS